MIDWIELKIDFYNRPSYRKLSKKLSTFLVIHRLKFNTQSNRTGLKNAYYTLKSLELKPCHDVLQYTLISNFTCKVL